MYGLPVSEHNKLTVDIVLSNMLVGRDLVELMKANFSGQWGIGSNAKNCN